jgi:4-amino-4-deoxy-L-arabinose transferase-like glycosyltransferase
MSNEVSASSQEVTSLTRGAVVWGAVLFAATLLLRGWQLGLPRTFVYDEVFYANDALDLFTRGVEKTRVGHPPLGKWLISLGFLVGHFSPFTWRLASLVAGAVVVVLVFACVRHVTGSTFMGIAAACLVLSDGVANAMGRYAFLDGFLSMFTTALLVVLVVTIRRPVTYALAVAIGAISGAALATKWSALPVIAIAFIVMFDRARRRENVGRAVVLACVAAGTAVLLYVGTYTPWIVTGRESGNCTTAACHSSVVHRLGLLPQMQRRMLESDVNFPRKNFQLRPGWQWITQKYAMQLFRQPCRGFGDGVCHDDKRGVVLVIIRGNRVLWLAVLPAVLVLLIAKRRRRRLAEGALLSALWAGAMWFPWVLRSETFLYYAAPMVPALAIVVVSTLHAVLPRRITNLVVTATVVAAALALVATETAAPWRA